MSGETAPGDAARSRAPNAAVLALAAAAVATAVALLVVAARGPAPASSQQDRVRSVAVTLRCPVCQDLSVADSPSPLARQMRGIIAADLAGGMSDDAIRQRFVAQYGEWILLSPPRRGIDLVAWVLPAILLLGGIMLAISAVRRWTGAGMSADRPDEPAVQDGHGGELSSADRILLGRAMAASEDPE